MFARFTKGRLFCAQSATPIWLGQIFHRPAGQRPARGKPLDPGGGPANPGAVAPPGLQRVPWIKKELRCSPGSFTSESEISEISFKLARFLLIYLTELLKI